MTDTARRAARLASIPAEALADIIEDTREAVLCANRHDAELLTERLDDYLAAQRIKVNGTCGCGSWPLSEYGPLCPSC